MDGESNTKKFHQSTLARRRVNKIYLLQIGDEWIQEQEVLKTHCRDHFGAILAPGPMTHIRRRRPIGISSLQARLTNEEHERLTDQLSKEEIKDTVWATHPTKAPGPDGLQGFFYQHRWSTVGLSVVRFIQQAFTLGYFDPSMCEAFVCLIPKVPNSSRISEFKPIALCNVLYKFITKCITMR